MRPCHELDALLTRFADGEASDRDRAEVEAHVALCPPCRERLAAERTVREVLHRRARALRERASDGLRDRCAAAAVPVTRVALGRGAAVRRSWVPLSLAATLVLAVAGVFMYGWWGSPGGTLAAHLAADHAHCFAVVPTPEAAAAPAVVEADFTGRYGWQIRLPEAHVAPDLELLGARRCLYAEGEVAHVLYRRAGRPLSLFVLPHAWPVDRIIETSGRIFEIMEHQTVIWAQHGRVYALVGDVRSGDLAHLAAAIRHAVE